MVSLLGSVVVVAALGALAGPTAIADGVGATQLRIGAVEGEMSAAAARVRSLTDSFRQAELTAATGAQELHADRATLAGIRGRLAATRQVLRRDALMSYTGGIGAPLDPTSAVALDPEVSSAYISVAVGNLNDSVDRYRLQQRQVEAATAAVAAQAATDREALAQAATARTDALAAASVAQGRLIALQTRLVALEAQQTAAAAAARTLPPPTAQGGPLSGDLVAVVRTIVGPSPTVVPPPAAPAAPAPPTTSPPAPTGTVAPPTTPSPTSAPPATRPPATPPTTTTPPSAPGPGTPPSGGVWLQLRTCESGNDYRADTGNGFYGAYQFSQGTWSGLSLPGRPDQEPAAMQDLAAAELQARSGWGNWPACAAALGLG